MPTCGQEYHKIKAFADFDTAKAYLLGFLYAGHVEAFAK
jgi:hypothetical protein